jgi:hypothetical protein
MTVNSKKILGVQHLTNVFAVVAHGDDEEINGYTVDLAKGGNEAPYKGPS